MDNFLLPSCSRLCGSYHGLISHTSDCPNNGITPPGNRDEIARDIVMMEQKLKKLKQMVVKHDGEKKV